MLKTLKFISKFLTIIAIVFAVSCDNDDSFVPVVAIDSVESDNFYPGDDVILTGSNFETVLFTFLEKNQVPFQLDGDKINFTLPESSAINNTLLTLVMADGYTVTTDIGVVARPFPIIQAVSPGIAQEGEQVTIMGISLNNLQSVTIGEVEASVVSSTFNELIITVPAGLAQNVQTELKVVTNGGEATPPVPFYVGENLLLNGDLELGDGDEFTNWGKWNGGDGMTATTADGEAYSGRSLRAVAVGGDAWRTQFASDAASTEVGAEYTLFMSIKAESDGGNIRFSTNPDAMYSGNYDITTEWQLIEWTFIANTPQTSAILDLGVTADAVYFIDNIALIQTGTPPPPPININGSFEDSDLGVADDIAGWEGINTALITGEITDEESHDGDQSLKITVDELDTANIGDSWRIQPTSSMQVVDGETYLLSVWFKGTGISNMKIAIDQGGNPGWSEWGAPEASFTNNAWTEVTYEFTAVTTNAANGNARFAISMNFDGNAGGVIYFDDLEVTIVE